MSSKAKNLSRMAATLPEGGAVIPAVNTITVTDSSYAPLPDTAVRTTGGYIKITGTDFAAGSVVYVNNIAATSTTYISPTELRAQLPALPLGSYSLMVFNSSTKASIWASGITYSAAPVWGTSSFNNTGNVINTQLTATGDAPLIYSLANGSVLPEGVTLSSSGLLSGTAVGITTQTTVTFVVTATDPQLQSATQLISISLTFYVGKLWSWGRNNAGQLGLGDTLNRSSPLQVGSLINWKTAANGFRSSIALKTDNTLWASGENTVGQLGDGTTISTSNYIQVGTLTDWLSITSGSYHTLAIKTDNTLWSWGKNNSGQLGLKDTIDRSSPVQVGILTNWRSTSGGYYHALAIKIDGTLWAWGLNGDGQLGLNNTTYRSSPVQVGTLTTWSSVSCGEFHTLAHKTDGTLWTWGKNAYGNLGDGTTIYRSSPVQIGTLLTWQSIASGGNYSMAIKTDGTLWAWGHNAYFGALGLNDKINRSSPVQVGTLTTWSKISAGRYYNLAIKTDNSIWACGHNAYGQLGDNSTISKSSQIQVGVLTNWSYIMANNNHALAISS